MRKPRASSSAPMAAEARPLPSDETTPPVTKMYFGATSPLLPARSPAHPGPPRAGPEPDMSHRRRAAPHRAAAPPVAQLVQDPRHRGTPRDPACHHLVAAEPRAHGGIARREARQPMTRAAVPIHPEPGQLRAGPA